jgi:carboxylate-amine ligase
MGVEEEFLVVDRTTGEPRAVARAVLRGADPDADLTEELQREQLETATAPCRELGELAAQVRASRAAAAEAAKTAGVAVAALATSPLPVDPTVTDDERYRGMLERFGLTAAEELTCGCHVHVAVEDDEEGVAVLDRIRPWLAPLLALSANSPFWNGTDSGYASYRSQVWWRWPSAGPAEPFGSAAGYAQVEQAMVDTDTVLDTGMVYFDARLSRRHPTVEIRVGDVCRDPDSAVLLAGLTRGLVETAARAWRAGEPPDPVRTELLRLASWRAGRSGLDGVLLDPATRRPAPAAEVLRGLVDHVAEALGPDAEVVRELLAALLRRGTGAVHQRATMKRTGELAAVVADTHLRPGE